jgi:glyoxylase-like metal-dependent hydrolase (beta-lactamase superfamily II)
MALKKIVDGVYVVPLGFVNAFLIDCNGLTLIDTGTAGNSEKILAAVRELGKEAEDIHDILITHLHFDHTGSLAAIQRASGAAVSMHTTEAESIRQGITTRTSFPPPGILNTLFGKLIASQKGGQIEATEVTHEIRGAEILPAAGGIQAIPIPGHTTGHTVFLWPQQDGVLFVGDALTRFAGNIGHAPVYEDFALSQASLKKLLELEFNTLCFSHGKPIVGDASRRVRDRIVKMMERK